DKNIDGVRRVAIICRLEERGAVENVPGRISAFLVARRSWNRDNQRSGGAILVIEGGNTGPVVTHPDRAVGGDGHTPWVNQIWIDVGSDARDVGLKIGPAVGIGARCNNSK